VPEGFWFVSIVVIALVAASEWARRRAIRGMRSPPVLPASDELAERRRRRAVARSSHRLAARVVHAAGTRGEVVAVPQWQKEP
jgi:hypothetical protein